MKTEKNEFSSRELMYLSKLYFSKYKKKIFNQTSGSYKELLEELNTVYFNNDDAKFIYDFLRKCYKLKILIATNYNQNKYFFIVDKKIILEFLNRQEVFKNIKQIIEDESLFHVE